MGTLTIKNKQYELGWFSDLYMRMCVSGAVLGASVGAGAGFAIVAISPFVIAGVGTRLLIRSVPCILNKLK